MIKIVGLVALGILGPMIWAYSEGSNDLALKIETQQRLQSQSEQEARQFNKDRHSFTPLEISEATVSQLTEKKKYTFIVSNITLKGATLLSPEEMETLVEPYEETVMSVARLNQLLKDLTNWYIRRGYITTRAYFVPQNIQDGNLELTIVEGRIEEFKVNSKPLPWYWRSVLISQKGALLNLRELERTIQILNRLDSVSITLSIEPGTKVGYSIVSFKRIEKDRYGGSLRYNTYSNADVPVYPTSVQFKMENIANLWESIGISLSQSNENGGQNMTSVGIYTEVPFSKYKAIINASQFEYTRFIKSGFDQTVLDGLSKSASIEVERELGRVRSSLWAGFCRMSILSKRNHVDTLLTPASSYRLVDLSFGIRHLYRHQSTLISSSFSIMMGVNRWSRLSLGPNVGERPAVSAKVLMLSSTYNRSLEIWKWPLQLLWTIRAQWSPSILYSERQMVLGSYYAVRGYVDPYDRGVTTKDTQAVGDSGGISRVELSVPLGLKFRIASLSGVSPYLHMDLGIVDDNLRNKSRQVSDKHRILSSGLGIKWNSRYKQFNASISKIIKASHSVYRPGWVQAMSLNLSF